MRLALYLLSTQAFPGACRVLGPAEEKMGDRAPAASSRTSSSAPQLQPVPHGGVIF